MADIQEDNRLGRFLKDRRAKLDPAAFGIPLTRRRTPGLRREEVAQRANVSVTWYTWLEQGRGGAPSADVLDRVSKALMLTDVEREHLYLIGLGRAPDVRYQPQQGVSPRLQNVLDALEQAIHARRPGPEDGLIHHSDRGVQYLAILSTARLVKAGIEPSVGSVGTDTTIHRPRPSSACPRPNLFGGVGHGVERAGHAHGDRQADQRPGRQGMDRAPEILEQRHDKEG